MGLAVCISCLSVPNCILAYLLACILSYPLFPYPHTPHPPALPCPAMSCSVGEVKRDAQRIDIMKKALRAKRQYLVATAKAETDNGDDAALRDLEEAAKQQDEAWDDDGGAAAGAGGGDAGAAKASAAAAAAKAAPAPAAAEESVPAATSSSGGAKASYSDDQGRLPEGWTLQSDSTGDRWYYNEVSGATSWVRPNADGSLPPSE